MKTFLNLLNNKVMKQYIKNICLFLMLFGMSTNAWGETQVAQFASGTVITAEGYNTYQNDYWYLSKGGAGKGAGFNSSNHTLIGNAYGTSANTSHHGFYILSKTKLDNICKITFTYDFCTTASECNNAKIYLGYSTDGSSWSAVSLTSGSQGTSVSPSEWDGETGSSYNETTWTFEFSKITSAYYAIIISRNGSMTSGKGFRFDDATVTFYSGCCEELAKPSGLTLSENHPKNDAPTVPVHGRTRFGWSAVSNASGYKISVSNGVTTASTTTAADRLYYITTLPAGNYTWSVSAIGDGDSYCEENPSTDGESFCVGADLTALTPSGLDVNATAADAVRVSWNELSGAGRYYLTFTNVSTSASTSTNTTNTYKNVSSVSLNKEFRVDLYAKNACLDEYYSLTATTTFILHNVSFNLQGHGSSISAVGAVEGDKISAPSAPTDDNYNFEGWYKESSCSNEWLFSTDVVDEDKTLYAKWTPKDYTISFNANGGGGSMDGVEKAYGSTYALPSCSFTPPSGKVFDHWGEGSAGGTSRAVGYEYTVSGDITYYAVWRDGTFTDYRFSCAELTLTPHLVTENTPIFITSTASKTVRSQDSILIAGSGLTPSTTLTFPGLPAKFEIKSRTYTSLSTDASGAIDAVAYIFYTPDAGDTDDGLDEIAGITVSVGGAKPKTTSLTQDIIGRHLPAEFVIAGKWGKAWYVLPANMSETATEGKNPTPVLTAVDDADAPTAAYCANTNAYNLVPIGGTGTDRFKANGDKIYLGMVNNSNYALFASDHAAAGAENTNIGRSSGMTTSTSGLGASYQWNLVQQTTEVNSTADVVYHLKTANSNTNSLLKISRGQGKWGMYSSGISEIRLLPLHEIADLDMTVEEWGTNKIAVRLGSPGELEKVLIDDDEAVSPALNVIGGDIYEISGLSGLATSPMSQFVVQMTVGSQLQQKIVQVPFIVTSSDATTIGLRSLSGGGSQDARNEEIKTVDVVVCDGGTLTVNSLVGEATACTFNNLYIYPGGKVNVSGNDLHVQNIYLRGGFSWLTGRNGESSYKHPQLLVAADKSIVGTGTTGHGIFYDLYLTGDQWYLMALPKDVAMSAVRNENGVVPTTDNAWVATYSGRGRTLQPRQQGWTDQENFATLTFLRGVGYEIAADPVISGRIFSTLRFPLQTSWSAETDCTPTVNSWGITRYNAGTLTANHVGWNLVGNPFYTAYQTSGTGIVAWGMKEHLDAGGHWTGAYDWDEDNLSNVKYYTIPNKTDYGYTDSRAASTKLDAFFPFYVQVKLADESNATLSFSASTDRTTKAPAYKVTQQNREIILDYVLSNENSSCTSGLNISDDYSADFDMEDKEASITNGLNELKVYTLVGNIRAAFNSLPEASIGTIPVGYKTTTGGTHAISLCEYSNLRYIRSATLIDHEEGDYEWDLLQGAYEFETSAQASGNDTRFTMRLELQQESEVPTGMDNITGVDNLFAIGYKSKIVLHGVPVGADVWTYDMTGKLVDTKRRVTSEYLEIQVLTQGIYNVRVTAGGKAQTLRTMVK